MDKTDSLRIVAGKGEGTTAVRKHFTSDEEIRIICEIIQPHQGPETILSN